MNAMLQNKIEEAARHYLLNEHKSPLNEILHQCDLKTEMQYHRDIESAYIAGATFALQNQWISVEEALPEEKKLGDSDFVFVKTSIRFPFLACYSYKHETWKDINHVAIHGVTHWMNIPPTINK